MMRYTFKKTYMVAQDLYSQLIANLEIAKSAGNSLSTELNNSVRKLGLFLRSRSSEFGVLENQTDVSVFLSICKSNEENLVLVFNYFLSDSPPMENAKERPSEFLKKLLNDFDKAIKKFKETNNHLIPQSDFKVSNGNPVLENKASIKKVSRNSFS